MTDEQPRPQLDGPVDGPVDGATAAVFSGLADLIYISDDFDEMHAAVVDAATRLVRGCDHASLMLKRNDRFVTAAASDDVARAIDAFERELGEGPCLDAIVAEPVQHDADLTDGSPWPRLTERVLDQTPVRSMAGFRLLVDGGQAGALDLFSDTPGALDHAAVNQGIVLASFVTVSLLAAHRRRAASTLRDGLASNREIGKAVGLLMAFHKVGDQEAFEMLRKSSQELNLKLSEVARQVVEHHNNRP